MNRREFIRRSVPVTAIPFLLNGFPIRAYGRAPFLETLVAAASATDRVLVLVQLGGGNDGINTVIPLNQDSAYMNARPNIAIPLNEVLTLRDDVGLHPVMTGMKDLYDQGKLSIVQGVSYPNPNLSHFRATDIWLTGSESNVTLSSGWLGRHLEEEFPEYPDDPVMPDPLAIQIGAVVSFGLQGSAQSMGIAIQSPDTFYQLVSAGSSGGTDTAPQSPAGRELTYIRNVSIQSQAYAGQVKGAADKAANVSTLWPAQGQNPLADQLKIVSRLIAGGLKTRVFVVNLGGFDNHSSQVDTTDTKIGLHATLLGRLSTAMMAFQDDVRLLGVEHRVLGMTFSEFGRRVQSNASLGTDHGTAAPIFFFGQPVFPGVIGSNPSLTDLTNGNLKMQYDFRAVYASVLQQWFGVSDNDLQAILYKDFLQIPIIQSGVAVNVEDDPALPSEYRLYANYPNPFNPSTTIAYELPRQGNVSLRVYDMMGREVALVVDEHQSAGRHQVTFHADGLPSGTYLYRIQSNSFSDRKKMVLLK